MSSLAKPNPNDVGAMLTTKPELLMNFCLSA